MAVDLSKYELILFDLDGTLNSLRDTDFLGTYSMEAFKHYNDVFQSFEEFLHALVSSTQKMLLNDTDSSLRTIFMKDFSRRTELPPEELEKRFHKFYETNFDELAKISSSSPLVTSLISELKTQGKKLAVATQPLFYELATTKRVAWTGLDISDFEMITHIDNIRRCKPHPQFYTTICNELNTPAEKTLMVGNDYLNDGGAIEVGIDVVIITDYLENKDARNSKKFVFEGTIDEFFTSVKNHN